jgi:cell division cycle protein 37
MSKPFDYSKWDNIELSDDEDDVHPNIDRESWFRMKHRSRVEREEKEEQEKKRIHAEMEKANQRIQVLEHDLTKLDKLVIRDATTGEDDDDDDDLDDREGLEAELKELRDANAARQKKLDDFERNKKWNVDNMCVVKEERTIINANAGQTNYTETGFAKAKDVSDVAAKETTTPVSTETISSSSATSSVVDSSEPAAKSENPTSLSTSKPAAVVPSKPVAGPTAITDPTNLSANVSTNSMDTYHEFTLKHADTVEEFMHLTSLEESKDFLLKYGDVLLQENASNYLLLASLEDEMNGYHEKMKQTCRQSQIISNIADLARSMKTHPGNVVIPFFQRMEQKDFYDGFMDGVNVFVQKIQARAVTKKKEMDAQRAASETEQVDLADVPREQRLGPGGLDPLEVLPTLPVAMQEAFESRDVEKLKEALLAMDPADAERHMKRCVDSGLWVDGRS